MPRRQDQSDMDNPDEHFAWAFAAGVPDPRGENYGFQPMIPAPCFPALSRMLWEFGFRHHDDLQTRWVSDYRGPDRNLVALGVIDEKPEAIMELTAEMLIDQFPDIAARAAAMDEGNRDEIVAKQAQELLSSLERLRAATAKLRREDDVL